MKLISVSSLLYYVKDLAQTQEFYESLGFKFDRDTTRVVTYLNWFSIEFRQQEEETDNNSGEFVYVKVDSIDELLERLQEKGREPDGEPKEVGGGVTELQVRDPDGYRLTFFQKK